jgi:hypothetical protein
VQFIYIGESGKAGREGEGCFARIWALRRIGLWYKIHFNELFFIVPDEVLI